MSHSIPKPETLERVKSILRRDLMLGSAARIDDDMPLIGGEFDLDSIDALLLVSSIEREFGIKIRNESIGREVFASLTTLARFIDLSCGPSQP